MTGHEKRGGREKGWMDRLEEPKEVKESEINGHILHQRGVLEWLTQARTVVSQTHFHRFRRHIYSQKYILRPIKFIIIAGGMGTMATKNHHPKRMYFKTCPCTVHTHLYVWVATINQCEMDFWILTLRVSKPLSKYVPYLFFSPVEA